jgi:anthranilate synthase/aminodeoxychorismate synthase-like glutamine amidotransferase
MARRFTPARSANNKMKVLLIDNYDSFTWNLVHYLVLAGAEVTVRYNDQISVAGNYTADFNGLLISPGPCTPQEAGNLMPALSEAIGKLPILGVCLGHQALGMYFGCRLVRAASPVHGKASTIHHHGEGVFNGLPNPMQVGRYHSLILESIEEDSPLAVTAHCEGEIMGIRHKHLPIQGVQFHPESVLTPQGQDLINNWVKSL